MATEPSKRTVPQKPQPSASAGASQAEATRLQPENASDLFRRLDRNGDGSLSDAELGQAAARDGNWAALDRNRNGRIERDEFRAYRRP